MTVTDEHLWRDVDSRAAVCVSAILSRREPFRETEVNQLWVATMVHRDDHILWFEVTVNNMLTVQELQRQESDGTVVDHVAHDSLV